MKPRAPHSRALVARLRRQVVAHELSRARYALKIDRFRGLIRRRGAWVRRLLRQIASIKRGGL